MMIDSHAVPDGTVVETEVCIVGAGAAGITLAREFSDSPFRVTLRESGGMEFAQDTQDIYDGQFSPVSGAVEALNHLLGGSRPGRTALTDLSKVIGNLDGVASFAICKALFGRGIPIEAVHVWCDSERQPNAQSRITVGSTRDKLGIPEVVVDWRLVAPRPEPSPTGPELPKRPSGANKRTKSEHWRLPDRSPSRSTANAHASGPGIRKSANSTSPVFALEVDIENV